MSTRWWLAGGAVPGSGTRDVYVEDGCVVATPADPSGFERVDCSAKLVCPGFVDLHARFADARDARCAAAGGFTTVVLDPVDRPTDVQVRMARELPVRTLLTGSITEGLKGEALADMGRLLAAGCIALSHGRVPIAASTLLRDALAYASRFDVPLFLRAADTGLEKGVVRDGPNAVLLGLPGVPVEAEEIGIATAASVARMTGARIHLTHLWSARGVAALRRAQAEGIPITASTTAHHLVLDDALIEELAYAGVCRFEPVLGDASDRVALAEAIADGVIDAVSSDHLPLPTQLSNHELQRAPAGQVGLQTALPLAIEALGVERAIASLTVGPRRVLGLPPAELAVGEVADIAVVDPQATWTVGADTLLSQANTPLMGSPMKGAVSLTLVGGREATIGL